MSAPPGQTGPPDAQLVARVLAGDREAFATVYNRYGDKLYDFSYSMLRHREEAADAVADSFVLFAERLRQLREPDRLRPWLYAIVRSECLRRLKARKRLAPGGEDDLVDMADPSMTPEAHAEQAVLRDLVWNAAKGLADRDRALLDLHLRQGLDGAELGAAMGVSASNAYVMLNRLRAQVERSLGALLIARLGRKECDELDGMLADWDGRFSPLIRKRVARHVDRCDVCSDRRKMIVSPWALLASVPVFTAPLYLRDRVVNETQLATYSAALDESDWPDGPPPATRGFWGRTQVQVAAVVIAVLAISAIVLLWPAGSDDDPTAQQTPITPGLVEEPSAPPASTPPSAPPGAEPGLSGVPQPPAVLLPGSLSVSTRTVDLGADRISSSVELTNTGDRQLSYRVASRNGWLTVTPAGGGLDGGSSADILVRADRAALAEGAATGSFVITWDRGSVPVTVRLVEERPPVVGAPRVGTLGCASPGAPAGPVPVVVAASDDTGLASVTLTWTGLDGTGSATMGSVGGGWSGSAGPFATPGSVTVWATATDVRGNSSTGPATTVNVDPCPQ